MNKKTIVSVYEDDATILGMYQAKFEKAGYAVYAHSSAVDIVQEVKKEKPDVILLDILMPKVDGHAAIRALQKDSATKDIPILVITNFSDDLNVQKALYLGAYDVIVKANTTPSQVLRYTEDTLAGKPPKNTLNKELVHMLQIDEHIKSPDKQ